MRSWHADALLVGVGIAVWFGSNFWLGLAAYGALVALDLLTSCDCEDEDGLR